MMQQSLMEPFVSFPALIGSSMNTPVIPTVTITSDVTRQKIGLYPLNCPQEAWYFSATALLMLPVTTKPPHRAPAWRFIFCILIIAEPQLVEENRTTRPYLTGIEATGGLKEYGVKIEGNWEQEVERVLAVC